jgi:hypothetical protein
MKGLPKVPKHITVAALIALSAIAQADDGFMDADTERARNNEANNACEINGAFGADRQACFSAYLCVNYGDCDGQNMHPIEPLPGGGVYRDNVGGANNG